MVFFYFIIFKVSISLIKKYDICKLLSFPLFRCKYSRVMQERCTVLMETDQKMEIQKKPLKEERSGVDIYLDQSLSAALDSFDNLFCRRCLVRGLGL